MNKLMKIVSLLGVAVLAGVAAPKIIQAVQDREDVVETKATSQDESQDENLFV